MAEVAHSDNLETAKINIAENDAFARFHERVCQFISPERVITNTLACETLGHDASIYRLLPRIVVLVRDEQEVQAVLLCAREFSIAITFRAAGTSLSGQAVTDSVLVQLDTPFWRQVRISDDGARIALGPSITGGAANAVLASYGRKIGPDPASLASAQIGGIVANNSSGMCCGTEQNSYRTIESLRLVLFDGTILDTGDEESRVAFTQSHRQMLADISKIAKEIKTDNKLRSRIIEKYKMKNTMGYGLNSFIDYEQPIDILAHAVIGSEGSLAFVSEARYRTVEDARCKVANLVFFPTFDAACRATIRLKKAAVTAAIEIADREAIRSIQMLKHFPEQARSFDDACAFLLIDVHGSSVDECAPRIATVERILSEFPILLQTGFTNDARLYSAYWDMRKGMYPSLGKNRALGTFFMQEDLVFPLERLAEGALAFRAVFDKHGYKKEGIIFGHARDGNLHACLALDLSTKEGMKRYEGLLGDLVTMVVDHFDGALKGEHGTGRNMAPFVVREWGAKALSMMKRLKNTMDPMGILNPGVVINDDPMAHVDNLKQISHVGSAADMCTECGFCERVCPTASYTMTPRQRIVALRTRATRKFSRAEEIYFRRAAIASCVGDSLCHSVCPVGIDTGELMRRELEQQHSRLSIMLASISERYFAFVVAFVRFALRCLVFVRRRFGLGAAARLHRFVSLSPLNLTLELFANPPRAPRSSNALDNRLGGAKPVGKGSVCKTASTSSFVFFPSCPSRLFGSVYASKVLAPLEETMANLCYKASIENVTRLRAANKLCCGLAYHSKGYYKSAERAAERLHSHLAPEVQQGHYPLVCDAAPCARRLQSLARFSDVKILDSIAFSRKCLLPRLQSKLQVASGPVIAHLPCASRRAGLEEDFIATLKQVSLHAPLVASKTLCCGFGGDLGFKDANLNKHALAGLLELAGKKYKTPPVVVSSSRTCEIGLAWHSGLQCYSLLEFIDRQSSE